MITLESYKEIDGWLEDSEANALQIIAEGLNVVELGCWKGKSSIAIGATAKSVLTVDHFSGDTFTGKAFTLPEAIKNIRKFDSEKKISILVQDFFDIRSSEIKKMLLCADLVYYDGDHNEESVKKFIDFISQFKRLPIIAFHDYDASINFSMGKNIFDSFVKNVIKESFFIVIKRLALIIPKNLNTGLFARLHKIETEKPIISTIMMQ